MKMSPAFAFFDVDETLVLEKSMFAMLDELAHSLPNIGARGIVDSLSLLRKQNKSRETINLAYYRALAGVEQQRVRWVAEAYVKRRLTGNDNEPYLNRPVVEKLHALRRASVTPVLLSGSAVDFLAPLARHLGIRHVLATELLVDHEGRYTGKTTGVAMIGEGKRRAVEQFLQEHQGAPHDCHGFGDHWSDVPFLSLVGNPHAICGNNQLEVYATNNKWPLLCDAKRHKNITTEHVK